MIDSSDHIHDTLLLLERAAHSSHPHTSSQTDVLLHLFLSMGSNSPTQPLPDMHVHFATHIAM